MQNTESPMSASSDFREATRGLASAPAPTVGRIVHYVSYGTPGGEYPSVCRAAVVTEAHEGTQAVGLAVLNPEGMFFNRTVPHNDGDNGPAGGTWHWPERV